MYYYALYYWCLPAHVLLCAVLLVQGASAKPTAGSKADPVQQLLVVYEAALNHLTSQGAVLNAVKPEYLLPVADFHKLVEDRTVAAAGNPDLEDALDYCAAVETSFGAYSAMSWNCVLLQVRNKHTRLPSTVARNLLQLAPVAMLHCSVPACWSPHF